MNRVLDAKQRDSEGEKSREGVAKNFGSDSKANDSQDGTENLKGQGAKDKHRRKHREAVDNTNRGAIHTKNAGIDKTRKQHTERTHKDTKKHKTQTRSSLARLEHVSEGWGVD